MRGELVQVHHWAKSQQDDPDLVLRQAFALEGRADVTRALASPDHVAEPGGPMIERAHTEARIHGSGSECIATAKASAEHAELLVALRLEPVQTIDRNQAWQ